MRIYRDNGKEQNIEDIWDNGKENGNYYRILRIYWDNGKEDGNYHRILRIYGIMAKKMETTILVYIGLYMDYNSDRIHGRQTYLPHIMHKAHVRESEMQLYP